MSRMTKAATALAFTFAGTLIALVPGTAAQAALPMCTTVKSIAIGGDVVEVPSLSNGSTQCTLSVNAYTSAATVRLQRALRYCNLKAQIAVDGAYGPQTKAAVVAFQRSKGISDDGIYGPVTGHLLRWPSFEFPTTHCLGAF